MPDKPPTLSRCLPRFFRELPESKASVRACLGDSSRLDPLGQSRASQATVPSCCTRHALRLCGLFVSRTKVVFALVTIAPKSTSGP